MNKHKKLLLTCAGLIILGVGGSYGIVVYRHSQQSKQTDESIRELYKTNPEGAKCVEDWYKKYPNTRPENQKADNVYLAPPCPGIPQ